MINLTEAEIHRVLVALDESKYYEPNLDMVEEVREMLVEKLQKVIE